MGAGFRPRPLRKRDDSDMLHELVQCLRTLINSKARRRRRGRRGP